MAASAASSASISPIDKAFRAAGRFIVSQATPSRSSRNKMPVMAKSFRFPRGGGGCKLCV